MMVVTRCGGRWWRRVSSWMLAGLLAGTVGCGPSERELGLQALEEELDERADELKQRDELLEQRLHLVAAGEEEIDSARAALEEQRKAHERRMEELKAREAEFQAKQGKLRGELAAVATIRRKWQAKLARGLPPEVAAERALVIDAESGEELFSKRADEKGPVSGLEKLLVALIVAEAGDLEEPLIIAGEGPGVGDEDYGIRAGQAFTRRQLLTVLMLRGSGDAALALARMHSVSMSAFVRRMNQRAAEMGMTSSRFAGPEGEQHSNLRDLAMLAMEVDDHLELRKIMGLSTFPLTRPDGSMIELKNRNELLVSMDEVCDGMFSVAAGDREGLIVSGEGAGGRRIVLLVGRRGNSLNADAAALLEWSLRD